MLSVRPGTSLDEDVALGLWQDALARQGERSGGAVAQAFRQRLRSPRALLLVAEQDGRAEGVLLAEFGRADDAGEPVGDGAGAVVPGLLHVGVLVTRPGSTATRALLRAITSRFERVTAWTSEPGPYELTGFAPTGRVRGEQVHLQRWAAPDATAARQQSPPPV